MTTSIDPSARPQAAFDILPGVRRRVAAPRLSVLDRVQTGCVFYIAAWAISPPLFASDWARIATVAALGLWFIAELMRRGGIFVRPGRGVLIAFFYMAYTSAVTVYADGTAGLLNDIQVMIALLFFILFEAARRHGLDKYRWVLWGVLGLFVLWLASTLWALRSDHRITRELIRNSDDVGQYSAQGVGGYALVYAALWAIPPLTYLLINLPGLRERTRFWNWGATRRALLAATLVLAVLLVVFGGYSIATLTLFIGAVTYFMLRGRATGRVGRILAVGALGAIALALSQTTLPSTLLDGLSTLTEGSNYHRKIDDLQASMEADASVGTVQDRTIRYGRSIDLFEEHPLIGVLSFRDVGKHSVILDNLAQFGLIGGLCLIYLLLSVPLTLVRASRERPGMAGAAFASLISILICAGLDDISASMGVIAFLVLPLAMSYPPRAPASRRVAAARARPVTRPAPVGVEPR